MINGYMTGFNYGWICPKCNRVYGPMVQECCQCNFDKAQPYKGPTVTFTTTASGTVDGLEVNNGQVSEE